MPALPEYGEPPSKLASVSGFRKHFLDRYFAYRRLYVDAILERAPRRATLAVLSEVARLAFAIFGCALTALIFWLLTAGAVARIGGLWGWAVVFALCAAGSTVLAALSVVGAIRGAADFSRVRRAANARRSS
jgi:hypothetical protein